MRNLTIGYFNKNAGDDLMIKALANINKNENFFLYGCKVENYRAFVNCGNIFKSSFSLSKFYKIKNYDRIVFIGGSLFQDYSKSAFKYYTKLYIFLIFCKLIGKEIHVYSSNIGPFNNRKTESMVKLIFKLVNKAVVRDQMSYDFCNKLSDKVILEKDIVHCTYIDKVKKCINGQKHIIGVSVIKSNGWDQDEYIKNLTLEIISNYEYKRESIVKLFAFHEKDDLMACKEVSNHLFKKNIKSEIITYDGSNLDIFISNFKNTNLMLCTRFHSVILALCFNIDFRLFSYSKKIDHYLTTHLDMRKLEEPLNYSNFTLISDPDTESYEI